MKIEDYTGMEKAEILLRALTAGTDNPDPEAYTQMFENCGLGVRVLEMKAGQLIQGKIHNEWAINILASGTHLVTSDASEPPVRLEAPQVFESAPGSQKLGMCLTDCVFINVMRSNPKETEDEFMDRIVTDTRVSKAIQMKERIDNVNL